MHLTDRDFENINDEQVGPSTPIRNQEKIDGSAELPLPGTGMGENEGRILRKRKTQELGFVNGSSGGANSLSNEG